MNRLQRLYDWTTTKVFDRLRDQVEGPRGIFQFDLAALDTGKPGFQCTGQTADGGIAGHDLDQGGCGFQLPRNLTDLFHREDLAYAERLTAAGVPCEVEVVPGAFHGFDGVVPKAPVSRDFFAGQVTWLRRQLTQTESATS